MSTYHPGQVASTSALPPLPPLPVLRAWIHRPQAIAPCFISDIYNLRTLQTQTAEGEVSSTYGGRDVFLLDKFPCAMVEVVGAVIGVDDKESKMDITLDDGDGEHVLVVTVKPPLRPPPTRQLGSQSTNATGGMTKFKSAKQRAALKAKSSTSSTTAGTWFPVAKRYVRKDIRVGDTVRIVGRVDEWFRRRFDGGGDWIRQVVVEEGGGGRICVVDPDHQSQHISKVLHLHQITYSKNFVLPPSVSSAPSISAPTISSISNAQSVHASPDRSGFRHQSSDTMASSVATSEWGEEDHTAELRNPSHLRSSQITDHTFRRYLMDYMTSQTKAALSRFNSEGSPGRLVQVLEELFPEYKEINRLIKQEVGSSSTSLSGGLDASDRVFKPSTRENTNAHHGRLAHDQSLDSTPTKSSYSLKSSNPPSNLISSSTTPHPNLTHTLPTLLQVPHLQTLSNLLIHKTSRQAEKSRRERIKSGRPLAKDLSVEVDRLKKGKKAGEWKLDEEEVEVRRERLMEWGLRCLSEDGEVVHIVLPCLHSSISLSSSSSSASHSSSSLTKRERRNSTHIQNSTSIPHQNPKHPNLDHTKNETHYLPLPPQLLLPLLLPHLTQESHRRQRVFIKKSDPRYGNGILLEEIVTRLKAWGEEGRWERVGEWCVEAALGFGGESEFLGKVGRGWVVLRDKGEEG